MAKMVKKAQSGIEAALAAKTAARNTKGPEFRPGQVKRMDRVFNANPERGVKVAKRMLKRANAKAEPIMKKGGKMIKKAQKGKKITPTADSTYFFEDRAKRYEKAANKMVRGDGYGMAAARTFKMAEDAKDNAYRQGLKATPGYDANGFPIPTKKKIAPKKKMQYGGEAASMVPMMKKGGKAMYGKSMMKKGGKCKNGC